MTQMIFVNLPITELTRSVTFYEAVGFTKNAQFSGPDSACMVLSESIYVMLLTHSKWQGFTSRTIPDAKTSAQVLLCVSRDSKAAVNTFIDNGVNAGGIADPTPVQDHPFMFGRSIEDPDGHIWETVWMDMSAMTQSN